MGTRALHPSISPGGRRLVFDEEFYSTNIWRVPLGKASPHPPPPFLSSSRRDDSPEYSPEQPGTRHRLQGDPQSVGVSGWPLAALLLLRNFQ
ncbi:hypothetical protein SBA3_4390001 [Candidatus Sulfopaludibacter sp. SbA3]|nr:hypothetical protein SBA3_4390001 [Candidatus Sulfopaludibacter sp. SbA3]